MTTRYHKPQNKEYYDKINFIWYLASIKEQRKSLCTGNIEKCVSTRKKEYLLLLNTIWYTLHYVVCLKGKWISNFKKLHFLQVLHQYFITVKLGYHFPLLNVNIIKFLTIKNVNLKNHLKIPIVVDVCLLWDTLHLFLQSICKKILI